MDYCGHSDEAYQHLALLERYVGVCNQALLQNRNRFPFKQILGAARQSERGRPVEVVIADDLSKESYVFYLKDQGIEIRPHGACGACNCVRRWAVHTAYLEEVACRPERYIENPARLNWEWMFGA